MAGKQQDTRLHKLLNLLQNAASPDTRKAAARQICEVAKSHPSQLPSILRKVQACLNHKSWDARLAAGEALGFIAEHFQHFAVEQLYEELRQQREGAGEAVPGLGELTANCPSTMAAFNLKKVLENGSPLLASGGQEYDLVLDVALSPVERIIKQKQRLKEALGGGGKLGQMLDKEDMFGFGDEDIVAAEVSSGQRRKASGTQEAANLLQNMSGLSARERNRLKRHAKAAAAAAGKPDLQRAASSGTSCGTPRGVDKQTSVEPASPLSGDGSISHSEDSAVEDDLQEWRLVEAGQWPFQQLCDRLCVLLLDPLWEVRHGAAVGLREILRSQARSVAVEAPVADASSGWCCPATQGQRQLGLVDAQHVSTAWVACHTWLEDLIMLLLSVLALDRFGDYVSDQVVAPVRETAAQVLGYALTALPPEGLDTVLDLLLQLRGSTEWEVRHGGMLGIKYLLAAAAAAVTAGAVRRLLQRALPQLLTALGDGDDDVRAAAADALLPVAQHLVDLGPQAVQRTRAVLWSALERLKSLSSASSNVMQLLALLYADAEVGALGLELVELVPRLLPFMHHPLPSVRLATVQCLKGLLDASARTRQVSWVLPLLELLARLLFQNLVVEADDGVVAVNLHAWAALLLLCSQEQLQGVVSQAQLRVWVQLAATPAATPLPPRLLLAYDEGRLVTLDVMRARHGIGTRPAKRQKSAKRGIEEDDYSYHPWLESDLLVGSEGEGSALSKRTAAARALAGVFSKLHPMQPRLMEQELLVLFACGSGAARILGALIMWEYAHLVRGNQPEAGSAQAEAGSSQLEAGHVQLKAGKGCSQAEVVSSRLEAASTQVDAGRGGLGFKGLDLNSEPEVDVGGKRGLGLRGVPAGVKREREAELAHRGTGVLGTAGISGEGVQTGLSQHATANATSPGELCNVDPLKNNELGVAVHMQQPQLVVKKEEPMDGGGCSLASEATGAQLEGERKDEHLHGENTKLGDLKGHGVLAGYQPEKSEMAVDKELAGIKEGPGEKSERSCKAEPGTPSVRVKSEAVPMECESPHKPLTSPKQELPTMLKGAKVDREKDGTKIEDMLHSASTNRLHGGREPVPRFDGHVEDFKRAPVIPPSPFVSPPANPEAITPQIVAATTQLLYAPSPSAPTPGSPLPYLELHDLYHLMRKEMINTIAECMKLGYRMDLPRGMTMHTLTVDVAAGLLGALPDSLPLSAQASNTKQRALSTVQSLQVIEIMMHSSCSACLASALVMSQRLPAKLNVVIQPLMNCLRREPHEKLQEMGAAALAEVVALCEGRKPNPTDKILRNMCAMLCADVTSSLVAAGTNQEEEEEDMEQRDELTGSGPSNLEDPAALMAFTSCRGASHGVRALSRRFHDQLLDKVPVLWEHMSGVLLTVQVDDSGMGQEACSDVQVHALASTLQVLRVAGPLLHSTLAGRVHDLLPGVRYCWCQPHFALRCRAAVCVAALVQQHMVLIMPSVLRLLSPTLRASASDSARMGGVQVVSALSRSLGVQLVPYVMLLVVPLLALMSDARERVRRRASACFAAVLPLLPLAHGLPPPPGLDEQQMEAAASDSQFLQQLLDNKRTAEFQVRAGLLRMELRPYQQEGVNWLAFLRRFGLHGVLADDMGLGKTLQSCTIMAAAMAEQAERYFETHKEEDRPVPSLVVCPPTLVGHWAHEMERYIDGALLRPLQYVGTAQERVSLRPRLSQHNVCVMSYESLRADVDWVAGYRWQYCILDEGHIIRNPTSKMAQACKLVNAQHRLLLSGTPIQNNVLELWSLFDFLMPGFLGSLRTFKARYGKAVEVSKNSKKGSKEGAAGVLALEALHKQVMPFVLRRTKQQVLHDLPPKIIQDVYCDPSPLQRELHGGLADSWESSLQQGAAGGGDLTGGSRGGNTLSMLTYLRKLCSHPLLVLDWQDPTHMEAVRKVLHTSDPGTASLSLRQLHHAPKLLAMRQLLVECGILKEKEGADRGSDEELEPDGGHRVLVFAQMKGMLDLVERDVLQAEGVSYLRLDGGTEASQRFCIAQQFNSDPTIDVLLLTTQVGGLGLNLTSADTVVFLEHDWNPQRDLQAMDRAHRLGQKRCVSVYRLIMRNTLEEKIMGLQQFKLNVANAVVNQDNMSMTNMDTSQLLDLFAAQPGGPRGPGAGKRPGVEGPGAAEMGGVKGKGLQAMLQTMGDLWDGAQYGQEFDMQAFMHKANKGQQEQQPGRQ